MNMLKKLWGAMKEPLEEAAKAAITLVFAPSIQNPAKFASAIPEQFRDEYSNFIRDPRNALMVGAILEAARGKALEAAEKINPED